MGKKIGKDTVKKSNILGILLGIFFQLCADPGVKIAITDSNGDQLETAQVGVPFVLHITVSNDSDNLPDPQIQGIKQFTLRGTGRQESTMIHNGVKEVSRTVQMSLIAEQQGEFPVGPASIEFDGKVIESEQLHVVVAQQQKVKNQESQQPFLELSFDKEKIYFGQPVVFILRFYFAHNDARLSQLQEPDFAQFNAGKLEQSQSGTKVIDEVNYRYVEWKTTVYPKESGFLKIPSLAAEYTVAAPRKRMGMFEDLAGFFGGMRSIKRVYSNEATLEVMPLPEYSEPVSAVGQFSAATLKLNTAKASQGEGVVATFAITGKGNLDQIMHPSLALPQNLTFYESGTQLETQGKKFEYIIQGLEPGDYTIEAQSFTFFNPEMGQYQILYTEPARVTITEHQNGSVKIEQPFVQRGTEEQLSVLEFGVWKMPRARRISMFLFIILLLIPLIGWIALILWNKRKQYWEQNAPLLRYKHAFSVARVQLGNARKAGHDSQLYHIMIELFGARLKIPRSEVSEQLIETTLQQNGFDEKKLLAWRLFFAHLTETAFSSYGTVERNDALFNKAFHWLYELEKVL